MTIALPGCLTPNESEAELLTGIEVASEQGAVEGARQDFSDSAQALLGDFTDAQALGEGLRALFNTLVESLEPVLGGRSLATASKTVALRSTDPAFLLSIVTTSKVAMTRA